MAPKPPRSGTLRQVPLADLHLFPGNARRGDVDMLVESLRAHGQYKPIIVNARDMLILAGNHTYQAAAVLEWKKIQAFFVDVDDLEAQRINLIDNRSNDVAGYDLEALVEQLQALPDLEATGYDAAALTELLGELNDDADNSGERDPDDVPASAPSRVDLGDVWQMGDHRLVCGDSTDPAVLKGLMGDEPATIVWTDPPYNVDYQGGMKPREQIENDALGKSEFAAFLEAALTNAFAHVTPGSPIYICHADQERIAFETAMVRAGWVFAQPLVWIKNQATFSRVDYHWQHEPILYGWASGAAHRWFGGFDKTTAEDEEVDAKKLNKGELIDLVAELRNERGTTVVREDKPPSSDDHPVIKPVEIVQRHLQNSSVRGDVVLDPFGGSGTTAIAAETLGRKARLVELDPAYCDVILRRWEDFTGHKAKVRKPVA